ncbi:MAG: c-type cytochrome [SAR324 cluster bacterium]|nr:c-type cytochrome [SAR324 cluster bacterium]
MKATMRLGHLFMGLIILTILTIACGEVPSSLESGNEPASLLNETYASNAGTATVLQLNENGRELYLREGPDGYSCSTCHGIDGKGNSNPSGPNLTKSLPSGTRLEKDIQQMWTGLGYNAMVTALASQEINDLTEYLLYMGGSPSTNSTNSGNTSSKSTDTVKTGSDDRDDDEYDEDDDEYDEDDD